jgi:hypothetical protein
MSLLMIQYFPWEEAVKNSHGSRDIPDMGKA